MENSSSEHAWLAPKFTRNKIPGADVLGFGFNIFGEYSTNSVTSAILQSSSTPELQWINPAAMSAFDVPPNVAVFNETAVDGSVYVFEDQQGFQQHLALKAGIKGGATSFSGAYRGAFSASMSAGMTTTSTTSYWYALFEANYRAFRVAVRSNAQWSTTFASDPDVLALPTSYSTENQQLFFRVFAKYGTHYVSEVELGGYLYYCASVDKSFSSSQYEVGASLSTEFSAVFAQAGADASAEWASLSQQWYESRSVQICAAGGDTGPLLATDPVMNENNNDVFVNWTKSVMLNPSVMNFRLRSLSMLYSGDQATAIDQAIEAYTSAYISVNAICEWNESESGAPYFLTGSSIILNGSPVTPNPIPTRPTAPPPDGVPGFQIAAFDQNSLEILLSKLYWVDGYDYADAYQAMLTDVSSIQGSQFIFVLSAVGIYPSYFPPPELALFLQSCGASLQAWRLMFGYSSPDNYFNYIMVGKQGMRPGTASETMKLVGSIDPPDGARADISQTIGLLPPNGAEGYRLTPPLVAS